MPGTGGDPIGDQAEQEAQPPWAARVQVVPSTWYTSPPPPQAWLLRDSRHDGEGVCPKGVVGLLNAQGGGGKTTALFQLARAVATGSRWFGAFDVPAQNAGKVLLVLGEDKPDGVHRKSFQVHVVVGGDDPPEGMIEAIPLSGMPCPMIDDKGDDAPFLRWLANYLKHHGPYALVALDPLARFGGRDAEVTNAAATRFTQGCESLVEPSGGATVLVSHHVNQTSQGTRLVQGSGRGVTGLTNGARFEWGLSVERATPDAEAVVTFDCLKTNVSKKFPAVVLRYSDGGVLVPMGDDERARADQARDAADPRAKRAAKTEQAKADSRAKENDVACAIVREQPGIKAGPLHRLVKARVHCADAKATTIITRVLDQGRVRREEDGTSYRHYVVELKAPKQPANANGAHVVDAGADPFTFINPEGS